MTNTTTQYTSCALRTRDKGGRGHKLEIRKDDVSNALTQVTKDYLVIENAKAGEDADLPKYRMLRKERTDYGKKIRKAYESGEVWESRHNMTSVAPRPDELANTLSTVLKDNTLLEIHGINEPEGTTLTNTTTQPVQQTPFNYIELFAGIGGFRQALDPIGGNCVFASEIDRFATQAYKALYDGADDHLHGDITKIDAVDVPDHDVLVGGFPCQTFSVAGKREGFADKTRGTLFFDIVRIMAEKQPKLALLENVKGLVGHDGGKTLDTVVESLNAIGYHVDFNVMNSKYFGVPQNRERIFIVALHDDLAQTADWVIEGTNVVAKGKRRIAGYGDAKTFNFDWPAQGDVTTRLRDVLEPSVDEKYYLSEEKTAALVAQLEAKDTVVGSVGHHPFSKKFEFNGFNSDISPTLLATDYKAPKTVLEGLPIREATKQGYAVAGEGDAVNFQFPESKTRRGRVGKEIANTLEASGINQGVVEQSPIMLGHVDIKGHDAVKRVYDPSAVGPTLTTMGGGHREPKITEEVKDGKGKEANTVEILRTLHSEIGEETYTEWSIRTLVSLQQAEVLQPELHEEGVHFAETSEQQREEQPGECSSTHDILHKANGVSDMQFDGESRCPSYRRKPIQQRIEQLATVMSELSHEGTLPKEVLRDLSETAQGSWILQQTLHQIQEIWGSTLYKIPRYRIRKLSPLECFRLQGFSDEAHQTLVDAGISDSQRYKMAGNALTVNVVDALFAKMTEMDWFNDLRH